MEIRYDLLSKLKTRKHNLRVEIDLYPYATELYEELDCIGIIERVKEIPQLGVIRTEIKSLLSVKIVLLKNWVNSHLNMYLIILK